MVLKTSNRSSTATVWKNPARHPQLHSGRTPPHHPKPRKIQMRSADHPRHERLGGRQNQSQRSEKSPSSIYSAATRRPASRTHGRGHYRQNRDGDRCGRVHRLRTLPPNPEMPPVQIAAVRTVRILLYSIDKELRETQAAAGSQIEVVPCSVPCKTKNA